MPSNSRGVVDAASAPGFASTLSPAPRLLGADRHHRMGTWGPIFFVLWKGEVEPRTADRIQVSLRAFAQTLGGQRAALLTVVAQDAPMPSSEARTALSNVLRHGADAVLASAVVMEGDGFRASMVRSVATGLAIVARQPFPHRVFARTEDAVEWIDLRLGALAPRPSPAEISVALEELRRE
jgi:hypothetical protein